MENYVVSVCLLLAFVFTIMIPYRIVSSPYNPLVYYEEVQYVPVWKLTPKTKTSPQKRFSDGLEYPMYINTNDVEGDDVHSVKMDKLRMVLQYLNILIIISGTLIWGKITKDSEDENIDKSSFPPGFLIMKSEGAKRLAQGVGSIFGISLSLLAISNVTEEGTIVDGLLVSLCAFASIFAGTWILIRISEWIYLGFERSD